MDIDSAAAGVASRPGFEDPDLLVSVPVSRVAAAPPGGAGDADEDADVTVVAVASKGRR